MLPMQETKTDSSLTILALFIALSEEVFQKSCDCSILQIGGLMKSNFPIFPILLISLRRCVSCYYIFPTSPNFTAPPR